MFYSDVSAEKKVSFSNNVWSFFLGQAYIVYSLSPFRSRETGVINKNYVNEPPSSADFA